MADYQLDLQEIQDTITAYFEDTFVQPVFEDALVDDETLPLPSIVIWYRDLRRGPRGRSFAGTRLDSYKSGFDVVVLAKTGKQARQILNYVGDTIIGHKFLNTGEVVKTQAIWESSRAVLDSANKPSRFAATSRFEFGVFANRVDNTP